MRIHTDFDHDQCCSCTMLAFLGGVVFGVIITVGFYVIR